MSFHLGGQPMVFGHAPAFHVGNGPWHPPQQYHSAYSQGPAVVKPAAMAAPARGQGQWPAQGAQGEPGSGVQDEGEYTAVTASPVAARTSLNANAEVTSLSREPSVELGEDEGERRDMRAYLGEQRLAGLTVLSRRMWECREMVAEIRAVLADSNAAVARVAPSKAMHA